MQPLLAVMVLRRNSPGGVGHTALSTREADSVPEERDIHTVKIWDGWLARERGGERERDKEI